MKGHGILVGDANKAPLVFEGNKEEVITTVDELGVDLIDGRPQGWFRLQRWHSLNTEARRFGRQHGSF